MNAVKMEARYWHIGLLHTELPMTADTVLETSKAFDLVPTKKLLSDVIMPS